MRKRLLINLLLTVCFLARAFAQQAKPDNKQITISADKVKAALELVETRVEKARLQLEIAQRDVNDARLALAEAHGIQRNEVQEYDFQISADGAWNFTRKVDPKK